MATLEKIRSKGGLIVAIVIGLALLLFIVGDMLGSGQSLFTNAQFEIAHVAGKSIPLADYQRRVDGLTEINRIQSGSTSITEEMMDNIHTTSWDNMLEEIIMGREFDRTGLTVTGEELLDMIQGDDPHPIILQLFSDPNTGMLNRAALYNFLQHIVQDDMDNEQKKFWLYLEDEIYRQRKMTKYNTLVRQGLFINSVQSARRAAEASRAIDFDYVARFFADVADIEITISEKELKEFYNRERHRYEQEETRDIKFVFFEVVPSDEDFRAAEEWINSIKPEYVEIRAEDTRQFVNFQSSVPFDGVNFTNGGLPEVINSFMFSASEGDVYGPYFENGGFRLAKLVKSHMVPDSVKARHILLQVNQQNVAQMQQLADSLKNMIMQGADFATLAREHSADGTAQAGGDVGWFSEGAMVKPFSDSCFYGKTGDVKVVPSQFGIHVIQVLAQSRPVKKVQVGILERLVEAGDETDQRFYAMASQFAGLNNTNEKFNKAVEEQNLTPHIAYNLTPLEKNIVELGTARDLVKWAYGADEYDVSGVIKIGNKYVVGTVEKARRKGFSPLNDVRAEIELEVRKKKKADQIAGEMTKKLTGANTIHDVAAICSTKVETSAGVKFNNRVISMIGVEPKLGAAAYAMPQGKISEPIKGLNGVYVIQNTAVVESDDLKILEEREKMFMSRNLGARANFSAYEILKKQADITDSRVKFY